MAINRMERLGDGKYRTQYVDVCRNCGGTGLIATTKTFIEPQEAEIKCTVCDGSGRVFIRKEISVTIEPYKQLTT